MKSTIHLLFLTIAFSILSAVVSAQPNFPGDEEIYRDDVVARVDIHINPDTLDWIYDNVESNIEWRATFIFNNGTIHDTIEDIGFRLRGNTSRQSAKKSFKVSFNTFESGRKYHGIEKMNLNGEHNDPTVARSKISWDLCRQANIPASRSSHVEVYINEDYYGLYINVEHVDEEFVDKRFNNNDGNLYKCLYPADLNYIGNDPDFYKFEHYGRRVYALKTNTEEDDYSDLAHFIDVLSNTPINDLECELEKIFNVQDYLKIMAMDVFTANWDGFIWNKNNFYLYHNTETGKFEFIPYDLDNTYGIDWFTIDWAVRDIYEWDKDDEYRPLYERLMEVQKYRDWYSWYFTKILEIMNPDTYFARLDEIRDLIYPYIQNDPYYPQDYGYSPQDFLDSYEEGTGAHVPYGLKNYITTRTNSANSQLVVNNIQPIVNYLKAEHTGPGGFLDVAVYAFDDEDNLSVNLLYTIDNGTWDSFSLSGDEEGKFTGQIEIPGGESEIAYQIEATDNSNNVTLYPCDPIVITVFPGDVYPLYINEFLASNATINMDEAGEYEDWLEVYNSGDVPVWLGDKYLSDNFDNPNKWQFPDYSIQPQEFLLVWCDNDEDQGLFHANFKISKGGEELGIFDSEGTGYAIIDAIVFDEQETDISYGRDPDAGDDWIFYASPTPGISNMLSASSDFLSPQRNLVVFPNPAKGDVLYLNKKTDIQIISLSGQVLIRQSDTDQIRIGNLLPGMYFAKSTEGGVFKFIKQ